MQVVRSPPRCAGLPGRAGPAEEVGPVRAAGWKFKMTMSPSCTPSNSRSQCPRKPVSSPESNRTGRVNRTARTPGIGSTTTHGSPSPTSTAIPPSRTGLTRVSVPCRVEEWRGGLGAAYLLPALSSAGASLASAMLRFHSPLIEPDGRISRIRLSDKDSRVRPREAARPRHSGGSGPARRAGTRRGTVTSPDPAPCACARSHRRSRCRAWRSTAR